MDNSDLTKIEALKLISPVIDDEVTSAERKAFMTFISEHEDVRKKYESLKKLKSIVHDRCPYEKAPVSLHEYVKSVSQQQSKATSSQAPIYDLPGDGPSSHKVTEGSRESYSASTRNWIISIAAGLLIIALGWGFAQYFNYGSSNGKVYNVEEYAYEHFKQHKGKFVPPTISTASVGSAEIQLASNYNMPMTIPALQKAEFKGVVYSEFVPNYKAPMLEYYIPSEDQYIYIFAFNLEKMEEFGQLVRYNEAVKACNKPRDFHIRNINGKHVVSWKWDDVWYAAISNHDGNTLASLVKPLHYSNDTLKNK